MLISSFNCELCKRSIPESKQTKSMTVDIRCGQMVAYDGCYRDGTHVCPFCADVIYERRKSIRGQEVQNPCKEFASPNWVECEIEYSRFYHEMHLKVNLERASVRGVAPLQCLRTKHGTLLGGFEYQGPGYVKVRVISVMPRDFLKVEFPNMYVACILRSKMQFFRD